ncbi:MAG: redoxin domain-containing protein [Candidatus Cohnella colombiensis]|uniref:Redoxin domain-containing protein n=1 Tax=Candidatus Cohnella colombiensis TaxID=3121368 RepID=A0AA95EZQ7_9BACL|nr:MAG: redoxin domain-containing protein [Cohnella sp.]
MGRYRKVVQYFILIGVLLIGGYAIGNSLFTSSAALKKGDKPPSFRLADLNNEAHDWSQYEGKPVIINFWGTFCPPCRDEMPALQAQYEKWKSEGLELVGINLSEDRLMVKRFINLVGVDFPILLDNDRKTEKRYGLKNYPTTLFVGRDGKIQDVVIGGPLSELQIEQHIIKLMKS